MSAFVVDTDTLNKIVSEMYCQTVENVMTTPLEVEGQQFGYNLNLAYDRDRLTSDLHQMNVRAVNQRYGSDDQPDNPTHVQVIVRTITAYKALRCFLYQCSEGDVPDEPLYKAMTSVSDLWAHSLVMDTPEYEHQPWG